MKYYFLSLFIFSSLINISINCAKFEKIQTDGFILLMGPTQSGKSCFINTITGSDLTIVGDDSGDSTTKTNELYTSRVDGFPEKNNYLLVDTMGLDDSEESELADHIIFSNTTIFIRDLMTTHKKNLDAFLIFESLTNDSNQLKKTIKKLKAVFTDDIIDSSIVVLNKNPNPNQKRKARLVQIAQKHGIKLLHWKSGCGNGTLHDTYYEQMNDLHQEILNVKSWTNKQVEELIEKLIAEGKALFKMKGNDSIRKLRNMLGLGGLGLLAISALNVPSFMIYNLSIWTTEQLLAYFSNNHTFLVTLAVEERIKNKFKKENNGDL